MRKDREIFFYRIFVPKKVYLRSFTYITSTEDCIYVRTYIRTLISHFCFLSVKSHYCCFMQKIQYYIPGG